MPGERAGVWLHLDSPDGDQGYPGTLSVTAGFAVDRDNRLELSYRATTDAPTVVGLTNHAFWNLAGSGTVDDHWLRLNSTRVVAFDDELIPLPGPPRDILGTGLDHTAARRLAGTRLDTMFVRPDFPSVRLDPGTEYRHMTVHEFDVDNCRRPR